MLYIRKVKIAGCKQDYNKFKRKLLIAGYRSHVYWAVTKDGKIINSFLTIAAARRKYGKGLERIL